jgi:hypothetical protein
VQSNPSATNFLPAAQQSNKNLCRMYAKDTRKGYTQFHPTLLLGMSRKTKTEAVNKLEGE